MESALPTAASTLVTIVVQSSAMIQPGQLGQDLSVPRGNQTIIPENSVLGLASRRVGDTRDYASYLVMDRHSPEGAEYIYFTVIRPDDSLILDANGERLFNRVRTSWRLIYHNTLHKALFNDPGQYAGSLEVSQILANTRIYDLPSNPTSHYKFVTALLLYCVGRTSATCSHLDPLHVSWRDAVVSRVASTFMPTQLKYILHHQ